VQPLAIAETLSPWQPSVFSLVVYGVVVLALIGILLFICAGLGENKKSIEKLRPYESGVIPTGTARLHYPVPFYLIAIFFLIFDVEGVYIFSWAVSCKSLGWPGLLMISFFITVLLLGLVYIWHKGVLDWGPTREKE
jgi:NADH-quinone oxidoreductase subunit A